MDPRNDPPVMTTSTPRAPARPVATSKEFVTTVSSACRVSRAAKACVVVPAPTTIASPSETSSAASPAIAAFASAATSAFSEYVGSCDSPPGNAAPPW
jgi:hypothetical protein